jgi:hypothetical protein
MDTTNRSAAVLYRRRDGCLPPAVQKSRTHLSDVWIAASVLQLRSDDEDKSRLWFDLEDDSGSASPASLSMIELRPRLERVGTQRIATSPSRFDQDGRM